MTTSSHTAQDSGTDLGARYRQLADGFAAVVASVPADAWSADSPCDGWTARDVVAHVIDTQRQFFDGHFGPTTIGETLMRFYGFDMVAHRWDVGSAAGLDVRFSDDEMTLMETAAAGFGPALYGDGVCKPGVEVAPDADRQTRLLATLGRQA